jgi:hypothetical protein
LTFKLKYLIYKGMPKYTNKKGAFRALFCINV